ncbi:hypothetical protein RCL1_003174 [Eukaryota sp. TZLM3-RCL]
MLLIDSDSCADENSTSSQEHNTSLNHTCNTSHVAFLSSNKGDCICLFENDTIAAKTEDCGDFVNSFVELPRRNLELTLYAITGPFQILLGFFQPWYTQARNSYFGAHALFVSDNYTHFRAYNHSDGLTVGALGVGEHITVDFIEGNKVLFAIPSLDYTHEFSFPEDHVFGISIADVMSAWQVSLG